MRDPKSILKTPEALRRILMARTRKHKLPTPTILLFDDLPESEKDFYRPHLTRFKVKWPLLLFLAEDERWTILAIDYLLSGSPEKVEAMKVIQLKK